MFIEAFEHCCRTQTHESGSRQGEGNSVQEQTFEHRCRTQLTKAGAGKERETAFIFDVLKHIMSRLD